MRLLQVLTIRSTVLSRQVTRRYHHNQESGRCLSFGAERPLLGTDFRYENGDIFVRAVDYISDPQIDPGAAMAILDQNAGALLGTG